jgi:hypothetical protein
MPNWTKFITIGAKKYEIEGPMENASNAPVGFTEYVGMFSRKHDGRIVRCVVTPALVEMDLEHIGPIGMSQHFKLTEVPAADANSLPKTHFAWLLSTRNRGWFAGSVLAPMTGWWYKGKEHLVWGQLKDYVLQQEGIAGAAGSGKPEESKEL